MYFNGDRCKKGISFQMSSSVQIIKQLVFTRDIHNFERGFLIN